jgi:hypothetical protein
MTLTHEHDLKRSAGARSRCVLISILSLLALVLGMFVMTSMGPAHAHSVHAASASAENVSHNGVPALTAMAAVSTSVHMDVTPHAPAHGGPAHECDSACELGCALAGSACVLLMAAVAASSFVISRGLSPLGMIQGSVVVSSASGNTRALYGPSLIALSINRT